MHRHHTHTKKEKKQKTTKHTHNTTVKLEPTKQEQNNNTHKHNKPHTNTAIKQSKPTIRIYTYTQIHNNTTNQSTNINNKEQVNYFLKNKNAHASNL